MIELKSETDSRRGGFASGSLCPGCPGLIPCPLAVCIVSRAHSQISFERRLIPGGPDEPRDGGHCC